MYSKKLIKVHVELSNICNAICPQCLRNYVDKDTGELTVRETLNTHELLLNDYKNIFDNDFFKNFQLTRANFCGNISDPIASRDLKEIIEYHIINNPNTQITIATNGGLRSNKWWSEFGKILSHVEHLVYFGIDGLEDTHSLYRINTNFNKVISNAKSFIKNGGKASWQFLEFKHNEHQVSQAKELANKLGFEEFKHIVTPRFANRKINKIKYTYKNKLFLLEESSNEVSKKLKVQTKSGNISCKALEDNEFFLDHDGAVYPCCWLAQRKKNDHGLLQHHDKKMNALKNSLTDILTDSFFLKKLKDSWEHDPSYSCTKFCDNQGNNRKDKYTITNKLIEITV